MSLKSRESVLKWRESAGKLKIDEEIQAKI